MVIRVDVEAGDGWGINCEIYPDIESKLASDKHRKKTGMQKWEKELTTIVIKDDPVAEFVLAIKDFSIGASGDPYDLDFLLQKIIEKAYKAGFNHGKTGLPQSVIKLERIVKNLEKDYVWGQSGPLSDWLLKKKE